MRTAKPSSRNNATGGECAGASKQTTHREANNNSPRVQPPAVPIMAPPTPVLSRDEIARVYRVPDGPCTLKSLTQHQCSFDGGLVTCVPFKRLFKECLKGTKKVVWEITDVDTNRETAELTQFSQAQKNARRLDD